MRAVGAPARACNLVLQVVQACQACRNWKRPGNADKLTYSLAQNFNKDVKFDLMFYRNLLQPEFGGERGIPICHLIGCCIRWSACTMASSKSTSDLLNCISTSWVSVFGNTKTLTLDGGTLVRAMEVDDWAMFNQVAPKYKTPHQTAWLVERERRNALTRSALQHCESQVLKESLVVSFVTVLGFVAVMHNAFTSINNHTPYQALLGRQPHLLPPFEGGYYGDLDVKGQNKSQWCARLRR